VVVGSIDGRGSATPIAAGDLILITQIQDASINTSNSSSYGGTNPGQGYTSLNSAGAYEYAAVTAFSGGVITLSRGLTNTYRSAPANSSSGQKTFQVIRIPQYSSATLAGPLTAPAWNGATGGVVAFDVAGNLNWASQTIEVSGRGFRGGGAQTSGSNATGQTLTPTDYVSAVGTGAVGTSVPNGTKGEGIAGTPRLVFTPTTVNSNAAGTNTDTCGGTDGTTCGYPGGSFARGAPGNAGGGGSDGDSTGNTQNTGGGGGGSYGSGGTGGYGWTPGVPPGSQTGGFGGGFVPSSPSRLFMGGGGGSGSTNNATGTPAAGLASSGAAGGGIVLVRAGTVTGGGTINANGTNANNTVTNDASGGGGGGGQVLVFVNNSGGSTGATVNANGGNGGTNTGGGAGPHGPGGGGSGGFAIVSGSTTINVAGGANGTTATSPTSTAQYGSTSSPGGSQTVTLAATQIPGVSPNASCLPRLTVTKVTSTPNAVPGGTATYTVTVTNQAGFGTATGVLITDALTPSNPFTYASTTSVTLGGGATRPSTTNPTIGSTSPVWNSFTIPGGGSVAITFVVNVPGATMAGVYQNPGRVDYDDPTRTSAGQTATPGGTYTGGGTVPGSNYASASTTNEDVTIRSPFIVTKSFAPTSINANGVSVLQVVVSNPNTIPVTGVSVSDNYPAGLENAPTPATNSSCGGSFVATAGAGFFTFSGGSIPASGSCTLQVSVTSNSAAAYLNTIAIGGVTSTENIRNIVAASATLLGRPTIAKSFAPIAVQQNTNSTLTIAITNPNSAQTLSNVAFSDTFPTNLVAAGGAVTVTGGASCTGFPATILANAVSLSVSGAGVGAGVTCSLAFSVRSAVAGPYPNTTTGATSTETPTIGNPSNTATLGVGLIGMAKSFAPAIVAQGQQSTVTLVLSNPTGVTQTNASFSDTLVNMQVNVGQTVAVTGAGCTGLTPTALTAGQTALSFTGLTVPALGCTLTFTVNSVQIGTNPNTTSGVSTALLPVGPPSNTVNLTVVTKPTISKAFSPASIQAGGVSSMVLTIDNQSSIPLTGISFTDTYPANVVNATPLTVGGSCASVTTTAVAGAGTFNVTAGTLPASSTCTITVNVTSALVGAYNNTTSGVATAETGSAGAASNTATLNVLAPASITKAFGTTTIAQNGTSLITFTLQNSNGTTLTGATFADTLVNMSVAATGPAGGTCSGASGNSFTAAQTGTLTFTGLTVNAGSPCTLTLSVTSSNPGANPNSASGVSSAQTPTPGAVSNTATLNVLIAPNVSKGFSPGEIAQSGTSTLTFTISNPNTTGLTNATFNDPLPSTTLAATGFSSTCSGAVTFSPALSIGGTNVNPTVASMAANESCSISVTVTSATVSPAAGHVNTTSAPMSTQTSVVGGAVGVANLVVLGRPTITKSFSPATMQTNGTSTITFTLTNPNATPLTGASFSDTFPPNMTTIAAAQNYIGGGRGTCTGAIPSAGTGAVGSRTFAGVNIPANGSCTVLVDVTATVGGVYNNIVSGVATVQTPTAGVGATGTLTVLASPTVTKAFGPSTIPNGAADFSTMTLTLTNPTSTALTGVAITDNYPSVNLVNVTPTVTTNACGGTLTATAGASALTLTGGSIPANSSCVITARVRSGTAAAYVNVTSGVSSTQTPTAGQTGTDTLNVVVAGTNRLIYTKSFSQAQAVVGTSLNMVFTIQNLSAGTAAQDVNFNAADPMPTVGGQQLTLNTVPNSCTITAAAPAASCGFNGATALGTAVPNAGSATSLLFSVAGTGLRLAANSTCTITCPVTIPATTTGGNYVNTAQFLVTGTGGFTTTSGDSATVNAVARPTIAKAFSPTDIGIGGTSTVTLTITNAATNTAALSGAGFTDTLSSMTIAATGPAGGTCAGASSNALTSGQTAISITGLTIPAGGASCTVTFVVTSSTASGGLPNSTSGVSATGPIALTAGSVSNTANLAVRQASFNKAFAPTTIDLGGISILTFTLTNGTNNPAQTGISFVDTLPGNLLIANPAGVGGTCPNVSATALPGAGVITVSNADMTLGQATCTITVNVTSNVPGGPYNNTNLSIGGLARITNSVTTSGVTVRALPNLTKAFSTTAISNGANATLTFTIANTGTNNVARADVGFVDTLPAGLTYSGAAAGTCASTAGAALVRVMSGANSDVLTVSGVEIAGAASCTVTITVTNRTGQFGTCPDANFTNGAPNVTVTGLSNGVTNQCLSASRAVLTKSFAPTTVQTATNSVLTFLITNGGGLPAVTGINYTDTLPIGLTVAGTPGVTTNCPAGAGLAAPAFTVTVAPTTAIAVTGASINAGVASCQINVNVVSATQGTYVNDPSRVTGATTNVDASGVNASLTVFSVPITTKSFTPGTISADGTSTMQFTITNNNTVPLTGGNFTDTLTSIRVSGAQNAGGTCGGVAGNAFANLQTGVSNFTGLTFPSGTCTITLLVTSDTPGTLPNTTSTVSVTGPLAMTGAVSNTANLIVIAAPPTITKAFAPVAIDADNSSTSTITFQLTNANSISLTGAGFTDVLANMTISANQSAAGTCTGAAANTFTNNQTALTFAGLALLPNASCTVTVTVKSNVAGVQPNTTSGVLSTQAGTGAASNTANLTVLPVVALTKAFAVANIGIGQTTSLTFTLTNTALGNIVRTGLSFTDTLPAGIVIANPTVPATTCTGTPTFTAVDGGQPFTVAGIGVLAGGTCTVTLTVRGNTVGGPYTNDAASITASSGISNGVTAQTISVAQASLTKAFGAATIDSGGSTTLVYTLTNGAGNPTQTGIGFTETLPANLRFNGASQSVAYSAGCTGPATITATGVPFNTFPIAGISMPAVASCTVTITGVTNVVGATGTCPAAAQTNDSTRITTLARLTNNVGAGPCLGIVPLPILTKAFAVANIGIGQTTSLTFTLTNTALGNIVRPGLSFTDTLPAGIVIANPTVPATTCTGTPTFTAVDGSQPFTVAGIGVLAGGTCTVTLTVRGNTVGGPYTNDAASITASSGISNGVTAQILTIYTAPTASKVMGGTITPGGSTTLTLSVTNPGTNPGALTTVQLPDTFPAGLSLQNLSTTFTPGACGTITNTAGGASVLGDTNVRLNVASLAAGVSCQVVLNVTSGNAGTSLANNVTPVSAGPVALTGVLVSANVVVGNLVAPTVTKNIVATDLAIGGTTNLVITVQNTNLVSITGATFTDTYPAGLTNSGAPAVSITGGSCTGTLTAANNGPSLALTAGVIPAASTCTYTVQIAGTTVGAKLNSTGAVTSTNAPAGVAASDTVNIYTAPTASKVMGGTITPGGSTTLTLSVTNPGTNPGALTTVQLPDTFPAGLSLQNLSTTFTPGACGTITNTAGGASVLGDTNVRLNVASLAAGVSCQVVLNVTSGNAGTSLANNVTPVSAGPVALTGVLVSANVVVGNLVAPTVTKNIVATDLAIGGTTNLVITVQNTNLVSITGATFTDTYPAGLTNSGAPAVSITGGSCTGTLTAANNGPSLALTAGVIPAASTCTYTVQIAGTTVGAKLNSTGAVTSTNAPAGVAASDTVNIYTAPTASKSFVGPIDTNGSTTLTLTFTNPAANPGSISGIALTDTFPISPAAMTLFNGIIGGTCAATVLNQSAGTPAAGNTGLQISGITLAAGASCSVIVNVTAAVAGSYINTTGSVTASSPVALTGATASDTLVVRPRPLLTKSFGANPQTIGVGQIATLTFTIDNTAAGSVLRSGLGFIDTLPGAGALTVVAATPQCGGGTVGVSGANSNVITVSGASVTAGASCTITATVTGVTAGSYINGPTSSSVTGLSANLVNNVADQTLHVRQATVAKTFGAASINDGAATALIFTLGNGAGNPAQSGIVLGDTLPTGLRFDIATPAVTYTPSSGGTCSGPANAAYDALTHVLSGITGVTMGAGTSACTISIAGLTNTPTQINASCATNPPLFTNLATNVTTTRATNTSTDQCLVVALVNPTLTKAWSSATINDNAPTNLVFTLTNSGTSPAQSGISFTDTLPASLRLSASPSVAFGAGCAGTSVLTPGAPETIAISGVSMTANTTACTVTVTSVTNRAGLVNSNCATNPAAFTNGATSIVPSAGVINGVTNQCLVVNAQPPALTKAWGAASITDGASTTLVFTLTNTGSNPAQSGIAFTESLPTGLRFTGAAPTVAFSNSCSGASVVTQATPDTIAFGGVAMPNATASCTITVTGVTNRAGQVNASCGASPAAFTNTSARISGTTNINSAGITPQCLVISTQVPTIAKAFSPATIAAGGSSTMTLTITNPNSVPLTAANFTDSLANIRVNGAQNAAGSCAGASGNPFTANQTGVLNFAGLTIPANGNCTVAVALTSNTPGMLPNTTSGVASTEAATGAASNTATLTVNAGAPTIVKAFVTPTISLGGTSQIDFTITNPNAVALTGANFSDTLANMFISATGAATGTCAGAGSNSFTISQTGLLNFIGLTIPASGACTVSIVVRSNTPGIQPNFATGVVSNEAPTGANSATVNLTVNAAAPTISKAFSANPISSGGVSTLTIAITNPNAAPVTVTSVTDTFPTSPGTGLVRAITPAHSTTCSGGTVTHSTSSVTLTGGTVPANSSCTFQIDVTAATAGSYANIIAIGALTTNAGVNAAAANATLIVNPAANVSVTKSGPASIAWGTTITYTVVVSNAGPDAANLTTFSDTVPAAITSVNAACGTPTGGAACGTVNVAGNSVTSTITTLPSGSSVTFTITGAAPQSGTLANNATAIVPMGIIDADDPGRTGAGNNTSATVTTTVVAPDLRLTKTASAPTFTVGSNASFTLTPSNSGSLATSGVITVVDTLPGGMTYVPAGSGGTGWTCSPSGQVVTCTSSNVIAASGGGNVITINALVLSNAIPGVTNQAGISGGNEPSVNTGNNFASVSVAVSGAAVNTFSTDGAQTGLPGSSVLYTHTFAAGLSGSVAFTNIHTPSPFLTGWTVQMFRDNNCNGVLDGVDGVTDITGAGIAVLPGQQVCIVVKSNIPAGATYGSQDVISVTATFTPGIGSPVTYTRVDITSAGAATGSGLVLTKAVRNVTQGGATGTSNSAKPGDVLEYIVTYSNSSNAALATINVADVTPAFTRFVSASCMAMPYPNNITACAVSVQPAMNGTGAIQWQLTGSLAPGTTGSVLFRVTLQ